MEKLKKAGRFFLSMKFAVILLAILAAACAGASLVTQGQSFDWYKAAYSERTAALIMTLHLDDAFHSWWFITINAFLCLNLLLCNVIKFPQYLKRFRAAGDSGQVFKEKPSASVKALASEEEAEALLLKLQAGGITSRKADTVTFIDGKKGLFISKNRIGLWGAWVCHLGILILILGFSLGQMTKEQYAVYGVKGQTKRIGDTAYALAIDDFRIDLREDDTVEQYTADITVQDMAAAASGREEKKSASISVNHPAVLYGYKFYQNSTGWAAHMAIYKEDRKLQEEILCAGEFAPVEDKPELVVYLNAFYPDYTFVNGKPETASGKLNNPGYLYSVYFNGQVLGMNVLTGDEKITIDEYTVVFSDPESYTMIQVKKDSFTWMALIGGLVTLLGLALAFYLIPAQYLAKEEEDGSWSVRGYSRKNAAVFREKFEEASGKTGGDNNTGSPESKETEEGKEGEEL